MENLRVRYTRLENNPLNRGRHSTDKFGIYIFGLFLIVWVFVTIHVLTVGQKDVENEPSIVTHKMSDFNQERFGTPGNWYRGSYSKSLENSMTNSAPIGSESHYPHLNSDNVFEILQKRLTYPQNVENSMTDSARFRRESHLPRPNSDAIVDMLLRSRLTFTLGMITALVMILTCLRFLEWDCRTCIHAAVIFQILSNILPIFPTTLFALREMDHSHNNQLVLAAIVIILSLLFWIFNAVSIQSLRAIAVDDLEELLKKSIQAVTFYPSLIIFTLCIIAIEILMVALIQKAGGSKSSDATILLCICGSLYVGHCIWLFAKFVITGATANWHSQRNQEEISLTTLLESISIVIRYHLGSILFGGTYILPVIKSAYTAYKYKYNAMQNYSSPFTEKICRLMIIFRAADYALVSSMTFGMNFSESIRNSFELMTKNSPMTVALFSVTSNILMIIQPFIFLSMCASLALLLTVLQVDTTDYLSILEVSLVLSFASSALLNLVVSSSVETTYLIALNNMPPKIQECIPTLPDESV